MKNLKYLIMVLLLTLNVAAEATVVTLTTGEQIQTEPVPSDPSIAFFSYEIDFTGIPKSDGNDGTLFFTARGDYTSGVTSENISISINGSSLGPFSAIGEGSGKNVITAFNVEDNEWGKSVAVMGSFLDLWTVDGKINMLVSLSEEVRVGLAEHQAKDGYLFEPYIDVTLQYTTAVPVPMGLWLFASGLIPLLVVRRR